RGVLAPVLRHAHRVQRRVRPLPRPRRRRGARVAGSAELLGPFHLRELVADDVLVTLAGRGLEEEKRAEAEAAHTPRYLDFTSSFASSAPGAELCTIWPRESTCTVSATESASGRVCSTSRIDRPSRLSSPTIRPTSRPIRGPSPSVRPALP